MGSLRSLNSVCRHCGNKLLRGEVHRDRDGARVCLSCAGNETFGREEWQAWLSWRAEVDRLVNLIEQWDPEDVHDLLAWLTELVALLEDTGECWSDYVDLPDLPQDLRAVVTAVDRHGRCLINGRVLSCLDDYEPDEAEVSDWSVSSNSGIMKTLETSKTGFLTFRESSLREETVFGNMFPFLLSMSPKG